MIAINAGILSAEVSLVGAELQRLVTADGRDLQWGGDPAIWNGRAPILFPVIGMLRGGRYRLDGRSFAMPKHGFARHSTFSAVEVSRSSVRLRLEANAQTRAVYPFEFRLDIEFSLQGASLTVAATVANRGERLMPASFGFHPAFRWPLPFGRAREEHRVLFAHDEPAPVRRIDGDGLLIHEAQPTPIRGRELQPRDALFEADALIFDQLRSRRVVYGAPGAPRIAVEFPDSPVLGVWTKPGAGFLCIEPWRGLPDPVGYEGELFDKPGMFMVESGAEHHIAMTLTLIDGETT